MATQFGPYKIYKENIASISDFQEVTGIAIAFAEKLFEKYPQKELEQIDHGIQDKSQLSYCAADTANNPVMVKAWLSFEDYSQKVGLPVEQIILAASKGELGEVKQHPKSGKDVIYWFKEDANVNDDIPDPGKYAFTNTVTLTAAVEISDDTKSNIDKLQQLLLSIGHSRGANADLSKNIEENLCKSILVLHWTSFENFLRQTIQELYHMHPELLVKNKQATKPSISYEEIFNFTSGFSSTEHLRARIVQKEVETAESEDKSVHGLINYIKSNFRFESDPYASWYIFKGNKVEFGYDDLMEVKDTRNTLIHDGGFPDKIFFAQYPEVPNVDFKVVLNENYLLRCIFILRSIAYNINRAIQTKKYRVASKSDK